MSTWNERIKKFSTNTELKNENLYGVIGEDGWDRLEEEIYDATDGRIVSIFTDEFRGVINADTPDYVPEPQYKEDCKVVRKILNKYYKKYDIII